MLRIFQHRPYRGLFATSLMLFALLAGCGDSAGNKDKNYTSIPFETLLPAQTRSFLQVSPTGQTDGSLADLLTDSDSSWRNHPLDIIRHYGSGIALDKAVRELLLAQVSSGGDEFLLLLHLDAGQADGVLADLERSESATYSGEAVWTISANGLSLVLLNRATWAIGYRAAVEAAIDVFQEAAPGLSRSPLAPYLGSDEEGFGVYFVYGLPALYTDALNPGSGEHSLNQALLVRGNLNVEVDTLDGEIQVVTPNAQAYTARLLELVPESTAGIFAASDDTLSIDVTGMSLERDLHALIKSLVIGMNAIDYAEAVSQDGNPPWLNFNVGGDPNSIFIAFEFRSAAHRSNFEAQHLPSGFTLAPLRILEEEIPRYYLVLNIYQSSGGLVEGARAEWDVFVNDPENGQPRFLVVQAAAEVLSADSVNLLTPAEPVSHDLEPDAIVSYVGVVDDATEVESLYFSSRINWPQPPDTYTRFSREFVVANDFIFWGNAVADRGLYNSTVHNRDAVRISNDEITLQDASIWAEFISEEPVYTLVYLNPLDIVISPWWNLDETYLDVTEAYRQELIDFKNGFYPLTVRGIAEEAMRGEKPALAAHVTGESVTTSYFHFPLRDAYALLDSLGVASDFPPAAIALGDGEAPQHFLTLAISGRTDDPCGLRADWMTYFLDEEGRPGSLLLEPLSSDACIHPVSLLGLPAAIGQTAADGRLNTRVVSPFIQFEAELDLARAESVLPALDWVETADRVCALNGVCDIAFYDGRILSQPLDRVGPEGITITKLTTPWDDFISAQPARADVRELPAIMAANPWVNVRPLGAP